MAKHPTEVCKIISFDNIKMTTLKNKYYSGEYDPWLASGIEYGTEPIDYESPVYHKVEAVRQNIKFPFPFYEKMTSQKEQTPEEFFGRMRHITPEVESIVMQNQLLQQRKKAEEKLMPIMKQETLEELMYKFFKEQWVQQTKNKNIEYEASLRSPDPASGDGVLSARELYLREQYEMARARGDMSINNPIMREELNRRVELANYFGRQNATYAQTIEDMGLSPYDALTSASSTSIGSAFTPSIASTPRLPGETVEQAERRAMLDLGRRSPGRLPGFGFGSSGALSASDLLVDGRDPNIGTEIQGDDLGGRISQLEQELQQGDADDDYESRINQLQFDSRISQLQQSVNASRSTLGSLIARMPDRPREQSMLAPTPMRGYMDSDSQAVTPGSSQAITPGSVGGSQAILDDPSVRALLNPMTPVKDLPEAVNLLTSKGVQLFPLIRTYAEELSMTPEQAGDRMRQVNDILTQREGRIIIPSSAPKDVGTSIDATLPPELQIARTTESIAGGIFQNLESATSSMASSMAESSDSPAETRAAQAVRTRQSDTKEFQRLTRDMPKTITLIGEGPKGGDLNVRIGTLRHREKIMKAIKKGEGKGWEKTRTAGSVTPPISPRASTSRA